MTLCLAAECQRHKRFFNAIVFATDFQVEGEIAKADIGRKLVISGIEEYPILLAGTQTRALGLSLAITECLQLIQRKPNEESRPVFWEPLLTEAVLRQKQRMADEIISGRFGITYEQFLATGKATFPDDLHREVMAEIARTTLDCWLLVLSFSHTTSRIFRIGDSGIVETCEHFAAIGSGYHIAEASLFQRSQNLGNDLGTTIYNVYEAMKLGSSAPGVGTEFQIGVAEWEWFDDPNPNNLGNVKLSFLQPPYYDYLAKKFARFGPKAVSKVKLKPRFIKPRERALVLTPKGEASPEMQRGIRRSAIAREREKKKRAARQKIQEKSSG